MSVNPIESFTPFVPPVIQPAAPTPAAGAAATTGVEGAAGVAGVQGPSADFGQILSQGIENLQGLHDQADQLAVQAATGDLTSLHDYTITATEAAVATQLTTAVRNKAVEAFTEIMRMSI